LVRGDEWLQAIKKSSSTRYNDRVTVWSKKDATGKGLLDALAAAFDEIIIYGHGPKAIPLVNRGLFPLDVLWQGALPAGPADPIRIGYVFMPLANSNGQPFDGPDRLNPWDIAPIRNSKRGTVWYWGCHVLTGPVVLGESILGIPWALLMAGNRAVLTSFVNVYTDHVDAFSRLVHACVWKKGVSSSQAIRSVQLYFLKSGHSRAHPQNWCPWMLIGDAGVLNAAPVDIDPSFEAEVMGFVPIRSVGTNKRQDSVPTGTEEQNRPRKGPMIGTAMALIAAAVILLLYWIMQRRT